MIAGLFSRHRRVASYDQENVTNDTSFSAVEGDFMIEDGSGLGISLSDSNVIVKIASGSPCSRKFKVGDTIVAVNGSDVGESLVSNILSSADPGFLTLTAVRARSGKGTHR